MAVESMVIFADHLKTKPLLSDAQQVASKLKFWNHIQ